MVEGDHLVKQHQVDVLKGLGVLCLTADGRLTVSQIVIGKVAHKSAGKRRKEIKPRTFVLGKDLADLAGGIVRMEGEASGLHLPVHAGDLQFRIEAQKGVAAPSVVRHGRFQHITVG